MDKVAVITGATRGIGRSIALKLGQSGYQVIVNGTKQALIDEVVQEIHRTGGEAREFVPMSQIRLRSLRWWMLSSLSMAV